MVGGRTEICKGKQKERESLGYADGVHGRGDVAVVSSCDVVYVVTSESAESVHWALGAMRVGQRTMRGAACCVRLFNILCGTMSLSSTTLFFGDEKRSLTLKGRAVFGSRAGIK